MLVWQILSVHSCVAKVCLRIYDKIHALKLLSFANYHDQHLQLKLFLSSPSFMLFDIPHYVKFNNDQLLLSNISIRNSMWFFFLRKASSLRSRFRIPHNLIEFQCDSNYYGSKNQFVYGAEFSSQIS